MKIETITIKKETAKELELLICNLMNGKKPYFKKQIEAYEVLKSKIE
jgi:hypothetical protein